MKITSYVVYVFDTNDSTGVKNKLEAKAEEADIYAWQYATIPDTEVYYTVDDDNTHIALKVR
ncbi:MAG: hypothetical protein IJP54_05600 [Synergistaceae bacterium]|nr:hypothetical protein [Synergistaceae bacterium]